MATVSEEQKLRQQQLLTKSLCDGLESRLEPKFAQLNEIIKMLTQQGVMLAAIEARQAVLENTMAGGAVATASRPKRATKADGAKATAPAAKGAVKANGAKTATATTGGDGYEKVKNGMLHYIYMYRVDSEFREHWNGKLADRFVDENGALVAPEDYFEAIPGAAAKTGDAKLNAIARYQWSNVLSEDEKKQMADEHKTKRDELARKAETPQCVEDADGGDS
jgi:hypothetical protein